MKQQQQAYNDGLVSIYSIGNTSAAGNMPQDGLNLRIGSLRFSKRTVGMNRFWTGKQSGVRIDMLIRIQRVPGIITDDVAILHDGIQYDIKQIQEPPDVYPLSLDLSLERRAAKLDFPGPVVP